MIADRMRTVELHRFVGTDKTEGKEEARTRRAAPRAMMVVVAGKGLKGRGGRQSFASWPQAEPYTNLHSDRISACPKLRVWPHHDLGLLYRRIKISLLNWGSRLFKYEHTQGLRGDQNTPWGFSLNPQLPSFRTSAKAGTESTGVERWLRVRRSGQRG